MNKTKRWASAAIALLLLATATGCANGGGKAKEAGSAGGEKPLLKVRYAPFYGVNGLAVRFGVEKGIFKEEGLDVEFIANQESAVVASLTTKELDVADMATASAIVAGGKGAPIKIVSSMFRTKGPFYLVAQPGINSVEELKGKKIGISSFAGGMHAITQVILKKHGIAKSDADLIANGVHDAAYASLKSGQVDATIIHEPFASYIELTGEGKLLAKGWDYAPNFHTGVLVSNPTFIEKNPEALSKLLKAYFRSQEYAKSHLEEYKKYFLANVKLESKEAVDKAFERELVLWENNPDVDLKALEETQAILKEQGFQDQVYDAKKLLDLRYIPKK